LYNKAKVKIKNSYNVRFFPILDGSFISPPLPPLPQDLPLLPLLPLPPAKSPLFLPQ
jgi:hypothetical protein